MNEEKLDRIIELLEDILKWIKLEEYPKIKDILLNELDTDTKKIVYELSNGESSPKISKKVDVTDKTIRDYWKKWAKRGIMKVHPDYEVRFCKVFSLEDFGIEVPENNKGKITELDENVEN